MHNNSKHVTTTNDSESAKSDEKSGAVVDKNEERSSNFSGTSHSDIRVVLATALERVRDSSGAYVSVRVLLDSGQFNWTVLLDSFSNNHGVCEEVGFATF